MRMGKEGRTARPMPEGRIRTGDLRIKLGMPADGGTQQPRRYVCARDLPVPPVRLLPGSVTARAWYQRAHPALTSWFLSTILHGQE